MSIASFFLYQKQKVIKFEDRSQTTIQKTEKTQNGSDIQKRSTLKTQLAPASTLQTQSIANATSTKTSSKPIQKIVIQTPPSKSLPKQAIMPIPQTQSTTTPIIKISTEELYNKYRPITLNVWCHENGKITSGTATIIHHSGILLTNAHVISPIQNTENCVLRSWNPFNNVAKFKTLYIPDQKKIISGTNNLPQNDFAFIKITESFLEIATSSWPYAPIFIDQSEFTVGEALFIFSFATEFLSYEISVKGIPLLFSTLKIKNFVTIDDNDRDYDALILESGVTNQAGSSGGPLVDANKAVVAILAFVGSGKTTGEREGIAILISYIDRVIRHEIGISLKEFLSVNAEK